MSSKKVLNYSQIRFHGSAQILNKALTNITPKNNPSISVRESPAGGFEFIEFDRKSGMNLVAWVPTSTIESITYYEEVEPKK